MNKHFWILTALCGAAAFSAIAAETATVNRARINVRGGPSLASEVVTQLQKGETVTVLDEVAVEKPKPGEPARWAAIKLPANVHVWVFTGFLENDTVKANRLNLRGGPGENFSVLGRLEKGAKIKEIRRVDEWIEVEAPEGARAFVDASYLDRPNAPTTVAATEPAKTSPLQEPLKVFEPPTGGTPPPVKSEPVKVAEAPPAESKPTETAKPVKSDPDPKPVETAVEKKDEPAPTVVAAVPAKPEENAAKPAETPAAESSPAPARVLPAIAPSVESASASMGGVTKRIVRREGQVRSTKFNIQAPTYFELSGDKGRTINYLNAEKTGLALKDYKGLRVVVTGEESIDPRFPDRPLLEVETIEVAP